MSEDRDPDSTAAGGGNAPMLCFPTAIKIHKEEEQNSFQLVAQRRRRRRRMEAQRQPLREDLKIQNMYGCN